MRIFFHPYLIAPVQLGRQPKKIKRLHVLLVHQLLKRDNRMNCHGFGKQVQPLRSWQEMIQSMRLRYGAVELVEPEQLR